MTTFYLLPPRPFLDDAFARFRDTWLPGLPGPCPAWPAFAELLDGALAGRSDVCVVTTGMGHSNAAASMTALVFSHTFDLSHTYFLVAGIGGIDPARGTLGSAAAETKEEFAPFSSKRRTR